MNTSSDKLKLTQEQHKISKHKGHSVLLGAAGTGKTTALLARAASLVKAGVPAKDIAVLTFSFRSSKLLESISCKRYGQDLDGVTFATFLDFAGAVIPKDKTLAKNNAVRDIIKRAMIDAKFKGSLREAEHVIRTFKGRSKKSQENEPHYFLLQVYKKLMDDEGLVDRNDIIRSHILALRKGSVEPHAVKHLLVDNLQDASQIQLVWLQEQLVDATLCATLNDDVTIFGLDGALGADIIPLLESKMIEDSALETFKLEQNFRTPKSIHAQITKPARQLKQRLQKQDVPQNTKKASITAHQFESEATEHAFILQSLKEINAKSPNARIGIVVRHDYLANRLMHACHKAGFRPATYARAIWDKPGAGTVLAMLYLIMGQSSAGRFERFLLTYLGVPLGCKLFSSGLDADTFLRSKNLPQSVKLSTDDLRAYHSLQRRVKSYIRLLQAGKVDAREVFKATVADTLPKLSAEEQEDALLAVRILLSLKGRLSELLPRLETETLPDMKSNIIITPVRETRNMEFDVLLLPYQQECVWPPLARALKVDYEHERRLFVQALSRAKGDIYLSYHNDDGMRANAFFSELS